MKDAKAKFDELDGDNDGYLEQSDMALYLVYLGYSRKAAMDQIGIVMSMCDKDEDGKVSFDELGSLLNKVHRFVIYRDYTIPAYVSKGCEWYGAGKSHPIPPAMIQCVYDAFSK